MTKEDPQFYSPRMGADVSWDDLKIILAIADHGSLTKAARALGLTQPTVGRRLAAFEDRSRGTLFERTATGLSPTAAGSTLLCELTQMRDLAESIQRSINRQDRALAGRVTISATPWFGSHIVAPLMSKFLETNRQLALELRAGWREHSLTKHEADISLRAQPFQQDNLIQRKVGTITFGLFAAERYLTRTTPVTLADRGAGHRLLVLESETGPLDHVQALRLLLPQSDIVWRTDNSDALLQAAEAGLGIALLPNLQARGGVGLVRLEAPEPLEARPIWLGYHPDQRHTPHIRAVVDYLCASINKLTNFKDL